MTGFDKVLKQVEVLAEELEYDVAEVVEEGEGGTVVLRNAGYSAVLLDVMDGGTYQLATIKEEDDEEKNHKEVKTLRGVKGYLKKFSDWQ